MIISPCGKGCLAVTYEQAGMWSSSCLALQLVQPGSVAGSELQQQHSNARHRHGILLPRISRARRSWKPRKACEGERSKRSLKNTNSRVRGGELREKLPEPHARHMQGMGGSGQLSPR